MPQSTSEAYQTRASGGGQPIFLRFFDVRQPNLYNLTVDKKVARNPHDSWTDDFSPLKPPADPNHHLLNSA
ncbi:hypothetical protein BGP77_16820 [Saccharospirillum sp. MSK14-1]|nr:hypothetical protein BGP77_16820 [Saccharospirillum sp. MSK14-1]